MKLNLRNKFLIPTITLVILGIAVSTVISYVKSKNAIEDIIKDNMTQITSLSSEQLNSWVTDIKNEIKRWGEVDTYQSNLAIVAGGNTAFIGDINNQLVKEKEQSSYYEFLGIADLEGNNIFKSSRDNNEVMKVTGKEFFKRAIKGETFISDIYKSETSSKPVFVVACPMYGIDEFGFASTSEITGVFYGIVDFEYFATSYLNKINIGETSAGYVINKEGVVASHKDKSLVLTLDAHTLDFGKKMLEQKDGIISYTFQGVDKFTSFRTLPETGWLVALSIDADEVFASVKSLRN